MKVSNDLLDGLNKLLARGRDAEKGYIDAANHINNAELRTWMLDYSTQRKNFCAQLESEIRTLGGDPDDHTSFLGEIHRAFLDVKGDLSENDPHAVLEECKRGEEKAYEDYGDVISDFEDEPIPTSTYKMLNEHRSKIKNALVQIDRMLQTLEPVDD